MADRRTFLKRTGQVGLGAAMSARLLSGRVRADTLTKGEELNKGTRYTERFTDRVKTCERQGKRDHWSDFNWNVSWVRDGDGVHRFGIAGCYHTYSSDQCSDEDIDSLGAQDKVKLDVYLRDAESSGSTVSAFDDRTSIVGYDAYEWRDWRSQEEGKEYCEDEIKEKYKDNDFEDPDAPLWLDAAAVGGGVAALGSFTGAAVLGGGAVVLGTLLLADDVARNATSCGVEEADNTQEFYRWWDFCRYQSFTTFVCEFDVVVEEPAVTLEIFQSVSHRAMSTPENVGYWTLNVPKNDPPSLMEKGFYEKDGGHQYHYG